MGKTVLPSASGVCNECLEKQTIAAGLLIASYCMHNQAGAVMPLINGEPIRVWTIYTPISAEQFAGAVSSATNAAKGGTEKSVAIH